MLPGGKAVLFTLRSSAAQSNQDTTSWDNAQVLVQSLDSGRRTVVVQGGTDARYVSTGHLIYVRAGTLLAVPFDPVRLVTTGNPTPVADGIRQADNTVAGVPGGGRAAGAAQFAVSQDGLFAYIPRDTAAGGVRGLTWVDRQGRETSLPVPDRAYSYPRISPDGTRIALDIRDQEQDIWVWDLGRETLTRLTFDPVAEVFPLWTPDGKRIVYARAGQGLYWRAADGTGAAERLTESTKNSFPTAFSRGGTHLVFNAEPGSEYIIRMLSLEGKRTVDLHAQPMVNPTEWRYIARRPLAGLPVGRVG